MSPRPIPAALAALSFVLALSGCGPKAPVAAPKETTPAALPDDVKPLETALAPAPGAGPAAASADERVLLATGEFIPLVRSELVARVTGRVAQVLVDEGARVAKGQPVLTLETEYLKLDAARAEAEVARAAAVLADAERDFGRKRELVERSRSPRPPSNARRPPSKERKRPASARRRASTWRNSASPTPSCAPRSTASSSRSASTWGNA
ncbi:MAG: biotin/lipoyl-binding protein [Holophagales bacterium]|nr:biotin/lipoyl-binding protein [Holophagales bacterium]